MKRILITVLSIVITVTVALTGTIAYLTDTDSAVNVATLGSVYIDQHEKDTAGNDYVNGQSLYPAHYPGAENEAPAKDDATGYYSKDVVGEMDKVVTVENTGKSPAYVRTWLAFEADANSGIGKIDINWNKAVEPVEYNGGAAVAILEDGVENNYVIYCVTYPEALAAGATSEASLLQVLMKKEATNEDIEHFGDEYSILAFSQAVQTDNLTEAYTGTDGKVAEFALNEAFGSKHPWTEGVSTDVVTDALRISNLSELKAFAKAVNEGDTFSGKTVMLIADIDLDNEEWTPINGFAGTFKGQGRTISNLKITKNGIYAGLFGKLGKATIENLNIDGVMIRNTASDGSGALAGGAQTANIQNVHVKNANIRSNHYVGGIIGHGYAHISNCSAENVVLEAVPNVTDSGMLDNGDKVGGIIGYCGEDGMTITNNSVKNAAIYGFRNLGGIAGTVNNNGVVTDNTVENTTISANRSYTNIDKNDNPEQIANKIIGRKGSNVTDENNTATDVTVSTDSTKNNVYYAADAQDLYWDYLANTTYDDTKYVGIAKPGDTIRLGAGNYGSYVFNNISDFNNSLTLIGEGVVVIEDTRTNGFVLKDKTLIDMTFENITFKGDWVFNMLHAKGNIVFRNCTFNANLNTAVHFDGDSGANISFDGCKFFGFNTFAAALNSLSFDNCEFHKNANYYAMNLRCNTSLTDCTFYDEYEVHLAEGYTPEVSFTNCKDANGNAYNTAIKDNV